jgi:hypothetical protein
MAPFENVVVERVFTLGAGVVVVLVVTLAAAAVESLALATVVVPAAESTHSFMLVIDIRVMLSERAFAAATVPGFEESTTDFGAGWRTNVVN